MCATAPPVQVLDAVVSTEWAAALAGVATSHLAPALARTDLWLEFQLLEKLLYKNTNQHSGSLHYRRLQEVRRLLGLLRAMQLDRRVAALHEALEEARRRGALPAGSVLLAYGGDQRCVPSHGAAAGVLRALQAACQLVEALGPAVHAASAQLLAQLAHSFFMPLCLAALAALARIQVLAGQLMLDAVRAYNALADAAALLPLGPAAAAQHGGPAEQAQQGEAALPQLLRAHWRRGLPRLERMPCPPGESLSEQAAAACARYALHVVQPKPSGPAPSAVILEEGRVAAPRDAPSRRATRGRQAAAAAPAPVLAVVEDRGVPISREDFVAAAGGGGGGGTPAASAQQQGAQGGAPGALPLLGVVEDDAPEEDPTGTVASLMEGEARGHLYRRAALGLGGLGQSVLGLAPASMPKPPGPPPAAAAGAARARAAAAPAPAAAATAAAATAAPVAAAPAPAPAAAPARKPVVVSMAAAKPAAPKPAFMSVGGVPKAAAPVKPAAPALPAKAPPAPPASAATAAAEPAAVQPAAPLALAAGGRKRKAAAAPPPAAEQPAAAPKSWEDWLEPFGGGSGSSAGLSVDQAQQQKPGQGKRRRGGR